MRSLIPPPPDELDAETQAVVDDVCGAMEWFDGTDGALEYLRLQQFRGRWYTALKHAGTECRQRIFEAVDALVRADDELFISAQGHISPRSQIAECRGRIVYLPDDDTGEMRRVLQWPTGTYASGEPSFEPRTEAA